MTSVKQHSLRTIAVQAGNYLDPHTGAVVPPIHTSTTYARDETYSPLYSSTYSRYGNPTCEQLENVLAKLDNGVDAMVFSSGMAAITTFMETLPNGSHIVAPRIMYHGAQDWLRHLETERNIEVTFFDARDPAIFIFSNFSK